MSSWLRTAVSKAVEVGGKANIRRAVQSIADSVSNQSVNDNHFVVVDRIFHDRNVAKDSRSFKHAAKRLEEVSVSCRGVERVQLLRRWLVALKEIERLSLYICNYFEDDEFKGSPRTPTIAYYYDSDDGGDPRNFRDVFLHSQALEGMVLSMILKAPNEEEVSLLMEIFRLCLTGGNEVHTTIMKNIQELAEAFLSYEDEVLVKREELLQYAQDAIAGLKLSADLARVDAEAYSIKEDLDKMKEFPNFSGKVEEQSSATTEDLKEALIQVQSFAKLEALLLRKKTLSNGDTPQLHAQKLDKLKVLLESLANSTVKAEKRISDQRYQKEEALNFRVTKASEMSQSNKDLQVEILDLQKRRDELEEELKKVNGSLSAAYARLQNSREEKEQFDEASNQILVLLKSKEDELSKAIVSYKKEVNIVKTWIRFLEGTWVLQTSYTEQQEKEVDGELERYGSEFVRFVIHLLALYKSELLQSVNCIRELVKNLLSNQGSDLEHENDHEKEESRKLRKNLEQELVEAETKFLTTSSVVDAVRKQFYAQNQGVVRKDEQKVKELFDVLEKVKDDFESLEIPRTRNDTQSQRPETTSDDRVRTHSSPASDHAKQTSDHKPDEICVLDNEAKQGHLESDCTLEKEAKLEILEYGDTSENKAKTGNMESNTLVHQEKSVNMESKHTLDNEAKPDNQEYEHALEKEVKPVNLKSNTRDYDEKSGNPESEYILDKEVESGNGESEILDTEAKSGNMESEHTFANEAKPRYMESNTSGNENKIVKLESEYTSQTDARPGNLESDTFKNEAELGTLESECTLDNEAKPGELDSEYGNINRGSLLDEVVNTSEESLMLSDHSRLSTLEPAIEPRNMESNTSGNEEILVKLQSEFTLHLDSNTLDKEAESDKAEYEYALDNEAEPENHSSEYGNINGGSLPSVMDIPTQESLMLSDHSSLLSVNQAIGPAEHEQEVYKSSFFDEEKSSDSQEKPINLVAELQKTSSDLAEDIETTSRSLPTLYDDSNSFSPIPTPHHSPQTSEHRQNEFAEFYSCEEGKPLDAREKHGNLEAELGKTCTDSMDKIEIICRSLQALHDGKTSTSPVPTLQHTPQTSGSRQDEFGKFFLIEEEKPLDAREEPGQLEAERGKTYSESMHEIDTASESFNTQYDDRTPSTRVSTPLHTPQTSRHEQYEFEDFYSSEEEKEFHDMEKPEDTVSEPGNFSTDS